MSKHFGRLISFEIGSRDVAATQGFYEKAFGWTFTNGSEGPGNPAGFANTPAGSVTPFGTTWDTHLTPEGREIPEEYFAVILEVDDLAETCRLVEEAGGKVTVPPTTNEDGTCDVAHIHDNRGVLIGLYSMNMSDESLPSPNPVPLDQIGKTPLPDALADKPRAKSRWTTEN